MTEYYKEGDCTICEKWFPLLHWHHTVPQSLGGKDSLQIPLCAQCHNLLHAHALAVVAKVKKSQHRSKPKKAKAILGEYDHGAQCRPVSQDTGRGDSE